MTDKLSLTELQLIIKDALYMALPDMYWVIAEISEIKENYTGHCYLELIEKHPDEKNVRARVKAIIWSTRYRFLCPLFENITGESLKVGMKILIRAKIEYHEIYGLSLIISDIDPSFTIGEMALKRQMIIKKLEEEGIFSMNKELQFPLVPQRIAVISSKNAAGYSDFIRHLHDNSYAYVFYTKLFETTMQGTETEESIINALSRIADHQNLFDIVAIIRGGGSQSDLSWFDNYNIAYYVTQFPLPVITGIGHEKDLSVTDMVANKSLKTPTAVADYLIDHVAETEKQLNEMSSEIAENSLAVIEKYKDLTDSFKIKLIPAARLLISVHKENLSDRIIDMIRFGKDFILKAGRVPADQKSRLCSSSKAFNLGKETLLEKKRTSLVNTTINLLANLKIKTEGFLNNLTILNPENVLRRGYTLTAVRGRIIKSINQLEQNDVIDTQFFDGRAESKVLKKTIKKKPNDN
ncbi:MAG: exodeoxyribonuclease VII large subunit [Bacteroidales bacterium]|nr:exodeoxyribonuclease VII large subunit [Bacteroidales bacterium]